MVTEQCMVEKEKSPNWFIFGVKNQTEVLDDFNHHLWILGGNMARVGWTPLTFFEGCFVPVSQTQILHCQPCYLV